MAFLRTLTLYSEQSSRAEQRKRRANTFTGFISIGKMAGILLRGKAEQGKSELSKAEQSRAKQSKVKQSRAKQSKVKQSRAEQGRAK